ncbi:hypothetical protein Tco_1418214 [Tanacetum coccineum]
MNLRTVLVIKLLTVSLTIHVVGYDSYEKSAFLHCVIEASIVIIFLDMLGQYDNSKLDHEVYGPPESTITKEIIEIQIKGYCTLEVVTMATMEQMPLMKSVVHETTSQINGITTGRRKRRRRTIDMGILNFRVVDMSPLEFYWRDSLRWGGRAFWVIDIVRLRAPRDKGGVRRGDGTQGMGWGCGGGLWLMRQNEGGVKERGRYKDERGGLFGGSEVLGERDWNVEFWLRGVVQGGGGAEYADGEWNNVLVSGGGRVLGEWGFPFGVYYGCGERGVVSVETSGFGRLLECRWLLPEGTLRRGRGEGCVGRVLGDGDGSLLEMGVSMVWAPVAGSLVLMWLFLSELLFLVSCYVHRGVVFDIGVDVCCVYCACALSTCCLVVSFWEWRHFCVACMRVKECHLVARLVFEMSIWRRLGGVGGCHGGEIWDEGVLWGSCESIGTRKVVLGVVCEVLNGRGGDDGASGVLDGDERPLFHRGGQERNGKNEGVFSYGMLQLSCLVAEVA